MDCCTGIAKYLLFFFNLICALIGLVVLGIGIYGTVNGKNFNGLLQTPNTLLLVLGGIIFFIAFFGCWGAIQENRCMLYTYGTVLLLLLLVLVVTGAYVLIKKEDIKKDVRSYVESAFVDGRNGKKDGMEVAEAIQGWGECCGLSNSAFWVRPGVSFPKSCCKNQKEDCTILKAYSKPCEETVDNFVKKNLKILGYCAVVLGGIEFLGVFFAFCVAHSARRY